MTGTDALMRSAPAPPTQQAHQSGGATSLAQQIRSFNQQQFTTTDKAAAATSSVDALLAESDDDDDDKEPQAQQYSESSDAESAHDDAAATLSTTGYESDEDDDVDDDEAAAFAMMNTLQLLQARTVRSSSSRSTANQRDERQHSRAPPSAAAGMELTHADERIAALEAQLLDAEETICHLKAEKRAALRDVERLTLALAAKEQHASAPSPVNIWSRLSSSSSDNDNSEAAQTLALALNGDDSATTDALRETIRELEARIAVVSESHALEHDEHVAVIREQELEIQKLQLALERMSETCEDLDARLVEAFTVTTPRSRAPSSSRTGAALQRAPHTKMLVDDGSGHSSDNEASESSVDGPHSARRFTSTSSGRATWRRTASLDSGASVASDASSSSFYSSSGWHEELVRHPTPHFDLDSPEVQYLLHSWTARTEKLQYLRLWLTQVASPRRALALDVPLGIELPRLRPEIRDGFLTLVVPLLRKQTHRDVVVHVRASSDPSLTDLRMRVVPRT